MTLGESNAGESNTRLPHRVLGLASATRGTPKPLDSQSPITHTGQRFRKALEPNRLNYTNSSVRSASGPTFPEGQHPEGLYGSHLSHSTNRTLAWEGMIQPTGANIPNSGFGLTKRISSNDIHHTAHFTLTGVSHRRNQQAPAATSDRILTQRVVLSIEANTTIDDLSR